MVYANMCTWQTPAETNNDLFNITKVSLRKDSE